jgi:AcrR family transcriptional regulator
MSGPDDARRRRTRQALIRAGETLLAERPVDAIAVDDIVREAGVAKGSFFNHFSDKSALALAVATEVRLRMEQRVGAVNAGLGDPEERLVRGVCAFVQYARTHPAEARAMLRSQDRPAPPDHPLNAGLRADLEAGLERGTFRAPGLDPAVLMVSGVCQILLSSVLDGPRSAVRDRGLVAETLALMLGGLGLSGEAAERRARDAAEDLIR